MGDKFAGTLPQWLLLFAVMVFGAWAKFKLGSEKLAIDAKTVEINAEDKLKVHYSGELQSLRDQIVKMSEHHLDREAKIDDRWRKLLQESEERHDECLRQRAALSKKVDEVEQRQMAQLRQFITYQQSIIRILPENMKTPELVNALETLGALGEPYSDAS